MKMNILKKTVAACSVAAFMAVGFVSVAQAATRYGVEDPSDNDTGVPIGTIINTATSKIYVQCMDKSAPTIGKHLVEGDLLKCPSDSHVYLSSDAAGGTAVTAADVPQGWTNKPPLLSSGGSYGLYCGTTTGGTWTGTVQNGFTCSASKPTPAKTGCTAVFSSSVKPSDFTSPTAGGTVPITITCK